jgi:prepilin-type N-terminal cleavage/methylation domain-containing protein/prepilin-type processing-associated H-X9-DG protein
MRRAFSLVELLVVIAILSVLIALAMPAISGARLSARRSVCAANLRAIGQGSAVYASEWNDSLPLVGGDAATIYWFWDITLGTGDALSNSTEKVTRGNPQSVRRMFYCPANPVQNDNDLWDYPNTEHPRIRVIGYGWLGARVGATPLGIIAPDLRPPPAPAIEFHEHWSKTKNPLNTELAFDAIISQHSQFTDIVGGSPLHHCTSHMQNNMPSGQNTLYFDGHVNWNSWSGPINATALVCGGNNPPAFWIANP